MQIELTQEEATLLCAAIKTQLSIVEKADKSVRVCIDDEKVSKLFDLSMRIENVSKAAA